MTTELVQKLDGVRDFKKILETVVKDLGETYSVDVSQIALSNPLDRNLTAICEYKLYPEANASELPIHMSFPLPLEGQGRGVVTLARQVEFHENEINWIRITLAELAQIIQYAQINDVVQRDTFRDTFLHEIQNVMQYSLGLGDALFMVVNILGKVLNASRCLFICVDDEKAGWKCYEFWQREKVKSCQDYGWPSTDSATVARSLLTASPMIVHEANQNSYQTPVQEELQLLSARSLLGVPLRSSEGTIHGCIILHHCEVRHDWTRGEIDMVQNVADTVAEALSKLPEEKRAHEPIMRLHQRDVIEKEANGQESILAVRRALRGAFGPTSIPVAGTKTVTAKPQVVSTAGPKEQPKKPITEHVVKPPVEKVPAPPSEPAVAKVPVAEPVSPPPIAAKTTSEGLSLSQLSSQLSEQAAGDPQKMREAANILLQQAAATGDKSVNDEVSATLQSLLHGMIGPATADAPPTPPPLRRNTGQRPMEVSGTFSQAETMDPIPQPATTGSAEMAAASSVAAPTPPALGNGDNSPWGNLDAIPTPTAPPARSGLGGAMIGKKGGGGAAGSPLMASLHKDKSKFQQSVQYIDGGTIEIDEAQAEAKLKQVLASSANPTSDYIFSIPGLDPRMLGRIDGWVAQIEAKDKYDQPHAMQVAEYSVAIGRALGLRPDEVDGLRLSGILHDVGKLGLAANVLQKPEEELSDTELLLIMKHPIDGASLVEGLPEVSHLAPVILAHHEEFDGNGYPAGLAGEDIPLASRIIHVASSYHNMVCPNKHRPGIPPQEAQENLRNGAGTTYDPQVVEAFLSVLQQ